MRGVLERYRHAAAVLFLAILTVLAYEPVLSDGFVWDDNQQIVRNPFLHADAPLKLVFTSDVWGYNQPGRTGLSNYYRPLQMLAYRWTGELDGLRPSTFHAANLAFHVLATFAAYAIFWRLTRRWWLVMAAAVLFALHPIHTEAVVWVAALSEIGCTLFYFLAFYCFLIGLELPAKEVATNQLPSPLDVTSKGRNTCPLPETQGGRVSRSLWWALSLVSFAVALLWKEMALTLPVLVAGACIFLMPRTVPWANRVRNAALISLPYWAVMLLYILLRLKVLGFFSRVQYARQMSSVEYILSAIVLMGKYWLKLLLPMALNAYHEFTPTQSPFELNALASVAFLLALVVLMVLGLRRRPVEAFLVLWTLLTLAPVLDIRSLGTNVFAERYLYLPSLGSCLLVPMLFAGWTKRLARNTQCWVNGVALALVAVPCWALVAARLPDWKDEYTLYSQTVKASPNSAEMRNALGQVLLDRGDMDEASRHFTLAISLETAKQSPDTRQVAIAYLGLGGVYNSRQQFAEALSALDRAMTFDRTIPRVQAARGFVLMQLGRLEEAQQQLVPVSRDFPNDEAVLNAMGVVAFSRKDFASAVAYFQRALEVLPSSAEFHSNLGRAYAAMGRYADAASEFEEAIRLSTDNANYHVNLGAVLGQMGRFAEAKAEFQAALALEPSNIDARNNLAIVDRLERQRAPKP